MARTLSVSLEELFGSPTNSARNKRGPASRLHQQIDAVTQLPKAKQQFVSEMLRNVLGQGNAR